MQCDHESINTVATAFEGHKLSTPSPVPRSQPSLPSKMRPSFVAVVAFASTVVAMPATQEPSVDPIYGDGKHVIDAICPAPSNPPLTGLFPFANLLGSIVNPILASLIGQGTIEFLEYVTL
jgi:hypothetical protein